MAKRKLLTQGEILSEFDEMSERASRSAHNYAQQVHCGRSFYDGYRSLMNCERLDGTSMPQWNDLPVVLRDAWIKCAYIYQQAKSREPENCYKAYCIHMCGQATSGIPLPEFKDLPEPALSAWKRVFLSNPF